MMPPTNQKEELANSEKFTSLPEGLSLPSEAYLPFPSANHSREGEKRKGQTRGTKKGEKFHQVRGSLLRKKNRKPSEKIKLAFSSQGRRGKLSSRKGTHKAVRGPKNS